MSKSVRILVDADACPVKEEVYRVAFGREVPVRVVSNSYLRVPAHPLIERSSCPTPSTMKRAAMLGAWQALE